ATSCLATSLPVAPRPPNSTPFPYTTLFRSPTGKVVAIEPQRRLLPVLYENMAINGFGSRVVLRSVALGKEEGTAELHLAPDLNRSEEHTSELQSRENLVCRLLLEKKKQ